MINQGMTIKELKPTPLKCHSIEEETERERGAGEGEKARKGKERKEDNNHR